ncbi:MAG: hypothetical protein QOH47_2520 [Sphingomonadales bacterium]|nr:hypothetical protein [Sphingomonadales bacterium]
MSASPAFFRSMSLAEDLDHPMRFAHYRPTRRALPIISSVLRPGSATMVIAPYGSGKSLAAGVAALAVRNANSDKAALRDIGFAAASVDKVAWAPVAARLASGKCGKVVVLSGMIDDPLMEIAQRLGMDRVPKSVEGFGKAMREGGWDHVAILWDEFGRHLEGLVADGRVAELDIVQRLAERASRASEPTVSFTLLLHQNLLSYATRLSETSRAEWRKVEGRFAHLRLVEDSQEFFGLVADVVAGIRPSESAGTSALDVAAIDRVIDARWLDGMSDHKAVAALLEAARPLTPGALQVLPTLVARVGQNERSLFSFLREADLSTKVGIEQVYSSFSDAMRTDVGIGGTYRRWVETESARSRADTPLKRELLAAACLLQLGASGERRRLPRATVELAVLGGAHGASDIADAFDELVQARLLLWRRHNDDTAVWHGADIDVALRVREERERRAGTFDVRAFLEERFPAPHLRAPGHNAQFGVNRYLAGRYASLSELAAGISCPPDQPGLVVYVLAEDKGAIAAARQAIYALAEERLIVVVPLRPIDIESAALELVAVEALRDDRDFLASDPMIPTEVDELQSVAFEQLARMMRGLLDPTGGGATWFAEGEALDVSAERPGTVSASRLLSRWFELTPRIANEQLMRNHASRTMQTARVRVVSAILERSDRPHLGFDPGERSAEGSIYRTVLENTGLRVAGDCRFADADELEDPGLREVWKLIGAFFKLPTQGERTFRPLAGLVEDLASPPYGLPRAVMSILIAAGFRHFGRTAAFYREGAYLPDMLGFPFDAMVAAPERFAVRVLDATQELADYLSEICYVFTHERPGVSDQLVRRAHEAIVGWLLTVPDGSKRSLRLEATSKALLRALAAASDPIDLLMAEIPNAFDFTGAQRDVVAELEKARIDIDHLRDAFAEEAVALVRDCFGRGRTDAQAVDTVRLWAGCFDLGEIERRGDLRILDLSVLRKAVETANGRFSEKSLANALSSILLQRSLDKWDDRTTAAFRSALREARDRIEAAALSTDYPAAALRPIVEAKLAELSDMLIKIGEAESIDVDAVRVAGGNR